MLIIMQEFDARDTSTIFFQSGTYLLYNGFTCSQKVCL